MENNELGQAFDRPFPKNVLKQKTRKSMEKTLRFDYAPWAEYTKRLNEEVGHLGWAFEVIEWHVTDRQAFVLGKLTVKGISKMQFGGSEPARDAKAFEQYDVADQLKGAASDALRKCAALFGLGLHLWLGRDSRTVDRPQEPPRDAGAPQGRRSPPGDHMRGNGSKAPLTDRQLNAIMAIGRALGWTAEQTIQHSIDAYGSKPEELSKKAAMAFIDELQKLSEQPGERPQNKAPSGDVRTEKQMNAILAIGVSLFGNRAATKQFLLDTYGNEGDMLSKSEASDVITTMQTMSTGTTPPLTENQLSAIKRYSREAGLSQERTVALAHEHCGCLPSKMNMRQAHDFISKLLDMLQSKK